MFKAKLQHVTILLRFLLLTVGVFFSGNLFAQNTASETFVRNSRPIIFSVSKSFVRSSDAQWITDSLKSTLDQLGDNGIVLARAAASPEGDYKLNTRLANNRRQSTVDFLNKLGVETDKIKFDVIPEDYEMLLTMMKMKGDADYQVVQDMWDKHHDSPAQMKQTLRKYKGYKLWNRLYKEYFSELRAVRFVVIDKRDTTLTNVYSRPGHTPFETGMRNPFPDFEIKELAEFDFSQVRMKEIPISIETIPVDFAVNADEAQEPVHRIPVMNLSTNLLYDGFYMPNYGMAPMLNGGIEIYPRSGHFTYGAWFMGPYWHKWDQQKFFQIRNYELNTRFYIRKAKGNADYYGFYLGAAVDVNKYAIGLGKRKGWQGEGYGAQLSLGYVLPISRHKQWKLHFSAGAGIYQTKYDPYLYGKPDFFGHEEDGKYYYDTNLYRDEFKKRQHVFTWMGPTQLGISISYDLLWRKGTNQKENNKGIHEGISFKRWEKK